MTVQVTKVEVLTVDLQPKPGALCEVYAAFREANVDIAASWGYEMGPGEAKGHFYARDAGRAQEVLNKLGRKTTVETAVYVTGVDRVGVYHDLLKKIADAKVNISATDAFAVDGKFGMMFFTDQKNIDTLKKALG
jgi:hypothetical protein